MSAFVHFLLALTLFITSCESDSKNSFQVDIKWQFINFTWPSKKDYVDSILNVEYIPENVAMAGIKIWKDNMYFAMPKLRKGVPLTLGWISLTDSPKINPLIAPVLDWSTNPNDCNQLQSVQSMEIDTKGVMWVLDGVRMNSETKCPTKLVLIDLEKEPPQIVHSYTFPEEISLTQGGFLNDIVIDDDVGGVHAYITDASSIDPGLIVYSLQKNRAWKLRDNSMFFEKGDNFDVNGYNFSNDVPIDGIALSPADEFGKLIYYCPLSANYLFAIRADIAKNESLITSGGKWRDNVQLIGKKQAQSDGLAMDNEGNLFYGLLPLYGVGKWNTKQDFSTAEIVAEDRKNIIWPDSFAFDNKGSVYLVANGIYKFFDPTFNIKISNEANFNVLKMYTGTKSYLYPKQDAETIIVNF